MKGDFRRFLAPFPTLSAWRTKEPARLWLAIGLLFVLGFGLPCLASASELSARFDHANRLYAQGNYPDAIAAYQKLIEEQQVSAPLFFNLGNARFKHGQIGQAIVAYRLACRMAPRDPDIRANLRFVRERVSGAPSSRQRWVRWLNWLTLNELTIIASLALWSWLLCQAAVRIWREWAPALRPYGTATGALAALSVLGLAILLQNRLGASSAVIIAPEAIVRYGPFDEAQSFYTLPDGAELRVLDQKNRWIQVSDRSKRVGWVQPDAVFVLPPG